MTYIDKKIKLCIKLAREASRDSWQVPFFSSSTKAKLRGIAREAIEDARYWKSQIGEK